MSAPRLVTRPARFALVALVILGLAYLGLGLFLTQNKTLGARHAPVRNQASFDFVNGSLADYDAYVTHYLVAERVAGSTPEIIANLRPFLLEPPAHCPRTASGGYQQGVVLTHGLLDSPYSMHAFGEALQARCFVVYGLLLPGHGSRPGAMLDSTWQSWAAAEHWAAQRLGEQVQTLFLSGHSVGGTLAILESSRNAQVDGLILFAPALAIAPASKYAGYIAPLGRIFPKAAWFEVDADEALYRYESFTFFSAAQTWELIAQTQQSERGMHRNLPVMTVAVLPDNTVGTPAILDYMGANSHPASTTVLYSQHAFTGSSRVQVVASADEEHGVLGLSHLGLMTPPEHPYFGRNGAYRNCEHYAQRPTDDYARCKAGQRNYYAEATEENLAAGSVERIAFNPFYASMLLTVDSFLSALDLLPAQ